MYYFPTKLRTCDEQQLNRIRQQVQEIRQLINKQIDNLELEIFQKVDQLIQNENNQQLYQMEDLLFSQRITDPECHMDEMNKVLMQFTNCTQNVITHAKNDELNILNFHYASKLLQDMKLIVKTMFQNASKRIALNQKIVNTKQVQQQENDKSQIWKHKNIAKSNERDISFTFTKNSGLAENFLAISNIALQGVYITPLFKGQNQFDVYIDDQDKDVTFIFRVHEGIDMGQSIYQEQILINHKQQTLINNCYEIYLKEAVMLKQGLIYTISIQSQNEGNINLHMFQGKCVSFGGDIKFLGKETENMPQIVNIKQNLAQSCLPGLILAK